MGAERQVLVRLTTAQDEKLRRVAGIEGKSLSELVRELVDGMRDYEVRSEKKGNEDGQGCREEG